MEIALDRNNQLCKASQQVIQFSPKILHGVFEDRDLINEIFNNCISRLEEDSDAYMLGAFLSIILHAACSLSNIDYNFLHHFIHYIYVEQIFRFFETAIDDRSYLEMQYYMKKVDFPRRLALEIENTKIPPDKNHYIEKETVKIRNILVIFRKIEKNTYLKQTVMTYKIGEVMNLDCRSLPLFLQNEYWTTVVALYNPQTMVMFRGLFQTAIEIITDVFSTVDRFRVAIIDFLSSIIVNDEVVRPFILQSNFHQVILRLLLQFPQHTFLQNSIINFILQALTIPDCQQFIISHIVAAIVYEGIKCNDTFVVNASYEIILKTYNLSLKDRNLMKYLKDLYGFSSIMKNNIFERKKILDSDYGGKVEEITFVYDDEDY